MSSKQNNLPKGVTDADLRHALRDIIGEKTPKEVTVEFEERITEPGWEGNVYKYSF